MGWEAVGIILVGALLILILWGVRLGFAFLLLGIIGMWVFKDWDLSASFATNVLFSQLNRYSLVVIVMFILMGYLGQQTGLATDIFKISRTVFGQLPGGLAITSVWGCAMFGACTGSSAAAAAIMSELVIPEMRESNYDPELATGVVAASGTLATLIPPSIMVVLYALITEQSAGLLLMAGLLPGIFSALIYALMIWGRCALNPRLGPPTPPTSWKAKFISLKYSPGIIIVFGIVVGGIYTGVLTPAEAGAAAAFVILIMALVRQKLTWAGFKRAVIDTTSTSAAIIIIIGAVYLYMHILAYSGAVTLMTDYVSGLAVSHWLILAAILAVYVILGAVIGLIGMLFLATPPFFPVIVALGFNPIWFGIIVIKMVEIACITPPVGINVYIVSRAVPDISVIRIFKGTLPFLAMDILTVALLIVFPQIVMVLPNMMMGG